MSDIRRIVKRYGAGRMPKSVALTLLFDTDKPEKWKAMKERKSKKKENKEKKQKHAPSNASITAILRKSATSNYAGNFSYYIQGDGKGRADKVYDKISPLFSQIYGKKRPLLVKFMDDYYKSSSVKCNFNYKSKVKAKKKTLHGGCKKPYSWEAHHMIPGEVFSTMKSSVGGSSPIFNARQYRLLLMSDYNVNNGNNMIALPTNRMDFFQPVHELIQHPSNHSAFTTRVTSEMKKIADKLNKLTDDLEKPHPEVSVKIAAEIKTIENKMWKLLIKLGKATCTALVTKQALQLSEDDANLIKFTSENGTAYPFGALA